jgi:polysaccharide biosynthesis transport protein
MNSEGAFEHSMRVIRRRWVIILIAVVTVPLVAFLYSQSQTKEYAASTTLLFETSAEFSPEESTRETATNEALAVLPSVAAKAAKALGNASLGEVLGSIEVSAANEMANLSTISATNESPQRAAEIANAYAQAYIEFRREAKQAPLKVGIAAIEQKIEELHAGESSKADALNEELNKLEIQEALQTGKASIVQKATPPGSPSKPKTKRNVLIGLLLGIVLAGALAALIDRADKRIRGIDEMEELFRLPLIGRIPKSKALDRGSPSNMLSSLDGEAFRTLRTNLRYLAVNQDVSRILIASPEPSDGKSTVARGLAAAMAESGEEVVLVEADLRKEGFFRNDPGYKGYGLSSVLAGTPLDSALLRLPIFSEASSEPRFLTVFPNGPVPPNPAELLESERMREVVEELSGRFETVIFDTPAFGVVSDAMATVPLASAILVIGGIGKTTRTAAHDFIEQISITHQRPLGLIVTMTGKNRAHYGYYRPSGRLLKPNKS